MSGNIYQYIDCRKSLYKLSNLKFYGFPKDQRLYMHGKLIQVGTFYISYDF